MTRPGSIALLLLISSSAALGQYDVNGANATLRMQGVVPSVVDPIDHDVCVGLPGVFQIDVETGTNTRVGIIMLYSPVAPTTGSVFAVPWGGTLDIGTQAFPLPNNVAVLADGIGQTIGPLDPLYQSDDGTTPSFTQAISVSGSLHGVEQGWQAIVFDPTQPPFFLDNTEAAAPSFIDPTAPGPTLVVTDVSPSSGSCAGGTVVLVRGCGFFGVADVRFDGIPGGSLNILDDQNLTVVAPPHANGTVDVSVLDAVDTVVVPNAFTYGGMLVTGISPTGGPDTGGTVVTLSGCGLGAVNSVLFDGIAAQSILAGADSVVTAISPAHAAGTVDVNVSDGVNSVNLTNAFTYTPTAVPTFQEDCALALAAPGLNDAHLNMPHAVDTTQFSNDLETQNTISTGTTTQFFVVGPGSGFGLGNGDAPDAVVRFTATQGGSYTFTLCGSTYDTRVWLMAASCPANGLIYNDDDDSGPCLGSTQSSLADVCLPAGAEVLVVLDGSGSSAGNASLSITRDPFQAHGLNPPAGLVTGNIQVDIFGCGLAGVNSVTFDGIAANILSTSDNLVSVTNPPHGAGTVNVVVSDGINSANLPFTYGQTVTTYPGPTLPDDGSIAHPLAIPITYCGVSHTTLHIGTNGQLSFSFGSGSFSTSLGEFFSGFNVSGIANPSVAPMWGDFNRFGTNGDYTVIEDTTNNFVNVQFNNQEWWDSQTPAGSWSCVFDPAGQIVIDLSQANSGVGAADQDPVVGVTNGDIATGTNVNIDYFTQLPFTSSNNDTSIAQQFNAGDPLPSMLFFVELGSCNWFVQ